MADALAGRVALVTGASRGIGLAVAHALAGAGARVAMLARTEATLREAAAAVGERARGYACDVSSAEQVESVIERIGAELGEPDLLVNNAGLFMLAPLASTQPGDFERMIEVNLVAPFRFVRALLPRMTKAGRGDIVTIGSIADRTIFPQNGAYAASKFGLRALHEVLHAEAREAGIRATLVSPGPVDTPLWNDIPGSAERRDTMLRPDAVADAVLWAVTRPRDVTIGELRLGRS